MNLKKGARILGILCFTMLVVQCERHHGIEYDYIYMIPVEDRYAFEAGDILLYSSSKGVIDSVRVKEVSFYTELGAGINGFGVTYTFKMDHYKLTLESLDDQWDRILQQVFDVSAADARCFNIETYFNVQTYFDPEEQPGSVLRVGCGEDPGKLIADSDPDIPEQAFEGTIYRDIYSCSCQKSDSAGLDVYWNLRYGIIHFGGMLDGSYISWDLTGSR